jgi:hypothetical protein
VSDGCRHCASTDHTSQHAHVSQPLTTVQNTLLSSRPEHTPATTLLCARSLSACAGGDTRDADVGVATGDALRKSGVRGDVAPLSSGDALRTTRHVNTGACLHH